MRNLISENFDQGCIPPGWFTDSLCHSFDKGGLRSGWLKSGSSTVLTIPLPGYAWESIHVEIEVEPIECAYVYCVWDGVLYLSVSLMDAYPHIAEKYQRGLARRSQSVPRMQGSHVIVFKFDGGYISASADGQEVITAIDPYPQQLANRVTLGLGGDCVARRVRIYGEKPRTEPLYHIPDRRGEDFSLEVNVDFVDDLIKAPFTRKMFGDLFAEFKSWGVRRVHWIYYGKKEDGWWDFAPLGAGENAIRTFENVGDIFKTAVESAHEHGIQIFGLIKPFDMGLRWSYGECTPEAITQGRVERVGGPVGWIAKFPAEHRELIMSRKSGVYGDAENDTFTRIDLVKADDGPCAFSPHDISLYVSDDNATYRQYTGPIRMEESIEEYPLYAHTASGAKPTGKSVRSRVLRFNDLCIKNKYVAISIDGRENSFANTLINMLHIFGEKGEERKLTYGVMLRKNEQRQSLSFKAAGVEFDSYPMVTSVCAGGYEAISSVFILDSGEGFIAFARGKDAGPLAALSPSFPEVRQWWLSWVRDVLDTGADGVELRVRNHHSDFAWGEYGFEAPVVEAFKARYGVDLLTTDDFDRAAFRRLRGEAYTQFYREAKQITNSYGKPLGLHISPTMDTDPEQGAAMEIYWDWRTWLKEGLADSITMKEVWPESRLAQEVLSYTRPARIPVVFCPYANHYWNNPPYSSRPGGERVIEDLIHLARDGGYDGYQFYECAAVIEAALDGSVIMREPGLREVLRKYFLR